ncbi:hypothetical protein IAU60_005464 [Kwoniella sp. DSM 27419]
MTRSLAPVLKSLGMRLPIVQAPMAGVSTPRLAAAVSNAGGLGSIGIGASDTATARAMIEEVQNHTTKAFNVNVFVHEQAPSNERVDKEWLDALAPSFRRYGVDPPQRLREIYKTFADDGEILQVLLDTRPAVVSFHFGLPDRSIIQQLKDTGTMLFATVTSLAEARQVETSAVDVLVAQGYEAGGHRGIFNPRGPDDRLGTLALTRLLVKTCRKPVIAAGGIMDGAGIVSVLDLGAVAAQLGTAFVVTDESAADQTYREGMTRGPGEHTIMTTHISGRPARSLQNRFTQLDLGNVQVPGYPFTYDAGKALNAAAKVKGEFGFGAQWAGQGAPLARSMPAGELMKVLEMEMARVDA